MYQSIILVDDHAVLRNGIKNWIETHSDYKVKYEAGSCSECMEIIEKIKAAEQTDCHSETSDCIAIVDISFKPDLSTLPNGMPVHEENCGFEIIKQFSALGVPCIVFSSHDSGGFVEHAMSPQIGAKGFVSKTADENILLAALASVASGKTYIQAELVTGLLEVRDITQTFTKKEKLVADALTLYNTNADVAEKLSISEKTVVNYLTVLYDKAGVENKLQFLEKMGRL